jgi:predicted O-linked N-acetylglucosamine transferase (SPINDLY family)
VSTDLQKQLEHAIRLHQHGKLTEAEGLYGQVLEREPANFTARHFLGVVRHQQGRTGEAIDLIGGALRLNPGSVGALSNYGLALKAAGRLPEALVSYDKAIALKPGDAELHNHRGLVLEGMGRPTEAMASYDKAVALDHGHADAWNNRGNMLSAGGRFDDALASFDAAIAANPRFALAWNNRGNALLALGRGEEALAAYERALAARPDYADALYNRGQVLLDAMRLGEALESYDRAVALEPGYIAAHNGRAIALQRMGRLAEALAGYDAALALTGDPQIRNNRASLLLLMKRFRDAAETFGRTLKAAPDDDQAFSGLAAASLYLCDWPLMAELAPQLKSRLEQGRACVDPLVLMGYHDDPGLQRLASENYLRDRVPRQPPSLAGRRMVPSSRIRIAYLSADFHTHPTASLMAGVFEHHDRSRFEIRAISFGPDDGSIMRGRMKSAFEHFHDARDVSDRDVARLLADNETDMAIDLNGHTRAGRPGILAFRPAPIQATYLGFPGTSGAPYMDYLIADRIVVPPEQQAFFSEKIAYLPHCYQANDSGKEIAAAPKRGEASLPDAGFVFCCFNNSWKITEPVFEIWMRLLRSVDGSVLWLLADNEGATANLRRAAERHGVSAARLIFAPRVREADHLARHRLADLFLDTLPYNAHTTASDALWAGLPVLTCRGIAFPAKVAASLLETVGLGELVTQSLADYESAALKLARDEALLRSLREKLSGNRLISPLFDTERFARDIERVYSTMRKISERGEPPRSFAIGDGAGLP